jgi:chromosome segregation ATPase
MPSPDVIKALEALHSELNKLEPAIKHVEAAEQVTQMVKTIPGKHVALLEEVKAGDALHKEALRSLFVEELSSLTEANKQLQQTTRDIQQEVKNEQAALAKVKESIQAFHDRVEKINFPERLDKLDANVAGIMAALQAVQSRLDNVERNIADRLRDMQDYQKETRTHLQQIAQRHQVLTYITWVLIIAAFAAGIFILRK